MIRKIIAVCLSLGMLFTTGCALEVTGNLPEDKIPATEAPIVDEGPPEPSIGGTLNLSMRKPATLNPLLNEDTTVDGILKLMFMQVTELDENMQPVPMLAEEINYASDGSNVLITLRDMNWSDGEKVKADDLVFSVNTLKAAPEGAVYKQCVGNVLSATAIDERTVRISYTHAFGASDYLLCFPVIPQHYYRNENKPDSEKNMAPLGNYMYRFESYDGREHVLLSVNDDYSGTKPYIQNIDVLITSDAQTDLSAYDQSLIDVLGTKLSDWGKYRGSKQTKIYEYPTTYYDFIGFNFNNPVLADIRVRKAIAHSLDMDKTVNDIYHSSAVRTLTPICPQSWLYEPNVTTYAFDVDAARELFVQSRRPAEADTGEITNVDTTAEDIPEEAAQDAEAPENETEPAAEDAEAAVSDIPEEEIPEEEISPVSLVILVNEENEERVKVANALAEAINGIGAAASVEVLPFAEYEDRLNRREYDIFIGGINFSAIPDLSFLFHSSNADSGMNFFAYRNDRADMLLAQSFGYATSSGYRSAMGELQKHIAEDLPVLSVCFRKSVLLTDQKIYGEIKPTQSNLFSGIEKWYMNVQEIDNTPEATETP